MMNDRAITKVETADLSCVCHEWKHFKFHFNDFEKLPAAKGQKVLSPQVTCFGKQWQLKLYPGGSSYAQDGNVSLFLELCARDCIFKMESRVKIKDLLDDVDSEEFGDQSPSWGWEDIGNRSQIIDPSRKVLVNRTLTIELSMIIKEMKILPFIPENPRSKMTLKLRSQVKHIMLTFYLRLKIQTKMTNCQQPRLRLFAFMLIALSYKHLHHCLQPYARLTKI